MSSITNEFGLKTEIVKTPAKFVFAGDIMLQGDLLGSGSVQSDVITDAEFCDNVDYVSISFEYVRPLTFPRNKIVTVVRTSKVEDSGSTPDRDLVLSNLNRGL